MNEYTNTPNTKGKLPDERLLETVKALAAQMYDIPSIAETFAKVLEKWDDKAAEKVREDGMPVDIIVGANLYEVFNLYLSPYCKVTKQPDYLDNPNRIFLSWFKIEPWGGLNGL